MENTISNFIDSISDCVDILMDIYSDYSEDLSCIEYYDLAYVLKSSCRMEKLKKQVVLFADMNEYLMDVPIINGKLSLGNTNVIEEMLKKMLVKRFNNAKKIYDREYDYIKGLIRRTKDEYEGISISIHMIFNSMEEILSIIEAELAKEEDSSYDIVAYKCDEFESFIDRFQKYDISNDIDENDVIVKEFLVIEYALRNFHTNLYMLDSYGWCISIMHDKNKAEKIATNIYNRTIKEFCDNVDTIIDALDSISLIDHYKIEELVFCISTLLMDFNNKSYEDVERILCEYIENELV